MSPSKCLLGALFYLSTIITAVNSHNITEILSDNGDFSQFNDLLSKTQVAGEINRRQTITVLAVDNGGASQLTSQPMEMEKKVLSLHVVLDYYDVKKLQSMKNKSFLLTTLFQASGMASSQLGFLNVTRSGSDQIMFGSASPGSSPVASLVKSVYSEPFNISVLQVSSIISPAGLNNVTVPAPAPRSSHAPPPSKHTNTSSPPTPSPLSEAPAPVSEGPVSADEPAPADAKAADAPAAKSSAVATRFWKLELGLVLFAWFFWMI